MVLELVSPPHFWFEFFKKNDFSYYILSTDQISLSDCFYFLIYWSINIYCNYILFPASGVIKFETKLSFLNEPFSYMTKKLWTQI